VHDSINDYPGDLDALRVSDSIEDFRAAVRAVASVTDVDGSDVTIVGHSEGATYVPLLMVDEPGVIAGVQLAGISTPIDEAIPRQLRDLADYLQTFGTQYAQTVANLRAQADSAEAALSQIRAGSYPQSSYGGATVEYWQSWMDVTDHLREDFVRVTEPILLLNGDFDFNVAPHHLERFRTWATEEAMTNARFAVLPNVTHAFVTVTGPSSVDPHFSAAALDEIVTWHHATAP
jgi:uncharacterized protein